MNKYTKTTPKEVTLVCGFCKKDFVVIWKLRHHRFCSVNCKCKWIRKSKHETVNCKHCGNLFERYKHINNSTGKPQEYCSNNCNRRSDEKKKKLRKYWIENNPMRNSDTQNKIDTTKIKKYGNKNYNNPEKSKSTLMNRYGINVGFFRKSNGKKITKPQSEVYNYIKYKFDDAVIEKTLEDIKISVDIFIPSNKLIIEINGDYWHMNPNK